MHNETRPKEEKGSGSLEQGKGSEGGTAGKLPSSADFCSQTALASVNSLRYTSKFPIKAIF